MMKDPSKNGKLRGVFFRHRKKCEAWCLWGIPRWNGIHEDFTSIFATNFTQKLDFNGFHYGFDWTRGFPRGFPMALFEPSAGLARTELLEAFETLALPEDSEAPLRCLRLSGCKQMHTRQLRLGCRQVVFMLL